jgi:hypothetical protein
MRSLSHRPIQSKENLVAESAPQVFTGVTPEQFARLTEKARAAGIDLNSANGTASVLGVQLAWNYAPETGELTIQCLQAPFFVSPASVDARIATLVKESLA